MYNFKPREDEGMAITLSLFYKKFYLFLDWEDVYLSMGTERSFEGPPYGSNWINLAPAHNGGIPGAKKDIPKYTGGIPPEYEDIGYGLSLQSKYI